MNFYELIWNSKKRGTSLGKDEGVILDTFRWLLRDVNRQLVSRLHYNGGIKLRGYHKYAGISKPWMQLENRKFKTKYDYVVYQTGKWRKQTLTQVWLKGQTK